MPTREMKGGACRCSERRAVRFRFRIAIVLILAAIAIYLIGHGLSLLPSGPVARSASGNHRQTAQLNSKSLNSTPLNSTAGESS